MMRSSKNIIDLYVAGVLLVTLSSATWAFGGSSSGSGELPTDNSLSELLREEILDTVVLDRPVHFTTPQATDFVAQAGSYRMQTGEPTRMKLTTLTTRATTVVDALNINHGTDITEPIALYVTDDEKFPHVVLLLPGGQGLEAVGSYDGSRARGIRVLQLTPIQIQKALQKRMEHKKK